MGLPLAPPLLEAADEDGCTPLDYACPAGHEELVEWLLQQGAVPSKAAARTARDEGHDGIAKKMKKAIKRRQAGEASGS